MNRLALFLLLSLSAVALAAPSRQGLEEDINQLMKRFMFDDYEYDYPVSDHHEEESPAEHHRHTTRQPVRHQQRSQAKRQQELREQQERKEQERKEQEQLELAAMEQESRAREEAELKEAKSMNKVEPKADEAAVGSPEQPTLREFTLIISKLLFHLSQM